MNELNQPSVEILKSVSISNSRGVELHMEQIAKILPLKGKYYGTVVSLKPKPGGQITVWLDRLGDPSERELESVGLSPKQWSENAIIDDGWGGKAPCRECDLIDYSHYESEASLRVAKLIVDAINRDYFEGGIYGKQ